MVSLIKLTEKSNTSSNPDFWIDACFEVHKQHEVSGVSGS